jgi:hypothetical protein
MTVDGQVKTLFVLESRGQVLKKNAGLGIVRDFADQFFQIVHSKGSS